MLLLLIFEPLHDKLVETEITSLQKLYAPLTFWVRSKAICFPRGPWFVVRKFWKNKMTFYTLRYLQIFWITQLHVYPGIYLPPFSNQCTNLARSSSLRSSPHVTAHAWWKSSSSREFHWRIDFRLWAVPLLLKNAKKNTTLSERPWACERDIPARGFAAWISHY